MQNTESEKVQDEEMKRQVQSILGHSNEDNPTRTALSLDDEKYLHQFSFAAMSFSTIYFWAMGDKVFAVASLIGGALFPPLLFVLPFFARARAWQMRQWYDFIEFKKIQKMWDAAAIYGLILLILIFYLSFQFFLLPLFQNFTSTLGQTDVNGLMETVNDLTNY
ncbi:MAG: hypothetical protein WCI57_03590 [Candidatus Berkelbacteria bacterium]